MQTSQNLKQSFLLVSHREDNHGLTAIVALSGSMQYSNFDEAFVVLRMPTMTRKYPKTMEARACKRRHRMACFNFVMFVCSTTGLPIAVSWYQIDLHLPKECIKNPSPICYDKSVFYAKLRSPRHLFLGLLKRQVSMIHLWHPRCPICWPNASNSQKIYPPHCAVSTALTTASCPRSEAQPRWSCRPTPLAS